MLDFTGRRVLVTGGSRGIGREVAGAFAERGARVALSYRRAQEAAREVVDSLPGGPHLALQADLGQSYSVGRLVEGALEGLGGLDIVVNNAGIHREHRLDEIGFEAWETAWDEILAVNLRGPANLMYFAARHMMKSGGGRIVNISSRGAFRGEPDMPAYAASKAGLNALSQSLARRLGRYGIFIGVVAPGFVETDMSASLLAGPAGAAIRDESPLGRVARPAEVAVAVLFLAADETEFLTGSIIDVNGASYLRS